jgi:hypothetical protein
LKNERFQLIFHVVLSFPQTFKSCIATPRSYLAGVEGC